MLSGARWFGEAGLVQGLECFQEQGWGGGCDGKVEAVEGDGVHQGMMLHHF